MNSIRIAEKNTVDRIIAMGAGGLLANINYFYKHNAIRAVRRDTAVLSGENLENQLQYALINYHSGGVIWEELAMFAQQALHMYHMELQKLESEQTNDNAELQKTSANVTMGAASEQNSVYGEELDNLRIAKAITSSMQINGRNDNGAKREKPNASVIARDVVKKYFFVLYQNGIYLFQNGRYNLVTEIAIKRLLNDEYRQEAECVGFAKFYNQVIDFVYCENSLVIDSKAFEETTYLIAFKNGFFNTKTMTFHEPDTRLFFTSNINLDFDNRSCECPNFEQFLWEIAGGDELLIARIYEVIGITISNDLNSKSLFCFQGVTNSAKSTLISFIASFFDEELVTALSVGEMDRNFAMAELIGKAICTDTELGAAPFRSACISKLKQLTSKDMLSSDVKYCNRVSFICRAKIFLATNHRFQLDTKDEAFMKRVVAIPFNYEIPKMHCNPEILRLFDNEKLDIAKKAILHYCNLRKNKYIFSGHFQINEMKMPTGVGKTGDELPMDRDSLIRAFLDECCLFTTFDDFETTADLHVEYQAFCNRCNAFSIDQKTLTAILKDMLGEKVISTKKRVVPGESGKSILYGMKLKRVVISKGALQ